VPLSDRIPKTGSAALVAGFSMLRFTFLYGCGKACANETCWYFSIRNLSAYFALCLLTQPVSANDYNAPLNVTAATVERQPRMR